MYDIAVLGGGAAGLVSAISAAKENRSLKIAVVERLPRVGKKILATGNGRCNLSNIAAKDYNYNTGFLYANKITKAFDAAEFFGGLGLFCRRDSEGRIYPYGNNASAVLDALRIALSEYGIEEICNFFVTDIKSLNGGYKILSESREIRAKKVIITCGGASSPSMGTDGSFFNIIKDKGINITPLKPALCPIMTDEAKALKGIRAKAGITLSSGEKSYGEVIFNENNISGICIFDVSAAAKVGAKLKIDLAPEYSLKDLRNKFSELTDIRKHVPAEDIFTGFFPKRLCQYLIKRTNKCCCNDVNISKVSAIAIADTAKELTFTVKKEAQWKDSQVTRGGIDGNEIDERLELKKMRGAFVAGEVIDIDGICGGYNLNWAWASGFAAGKNAAER